jgi:hypothetical protein
VPLLLNLYVSVCPSILGQGPGLVAIDPCAPGATTARQSRVDLPHTSRVGRMSRTGID